jgi:hypothetical protein
VVREEDATSHFYEKQWLQQRLITLRMPGGSQGERIQSSLRLFDWLARESCPMPSMFLMPDVKTEQLPYGLDQLASLRAALAQVQAPLQQAILGLEKATAGQVEHLARILELLAGLGWPPRTMGAVGRQITSLFWEKLAGATDDPAERQRLLRKALAAAEGAQDLERIEQQLHELRRQAHPQRHDGPG